MTDVSSLFDQTLASLARPRHASYRLQLGPSLGFDHVEALAPYLEALGVSEAYLSPCFIPLGDPGLEGAYVDRFTGLRIATEWRADGPGLRVAGLFGVLPVAMLEREGGGG